MELTEYVRFSDFKEIKLFNNRVTLSRWQQRKDDPFPPAVQLGPNSVAWKVSEVEAWLERRGRGRLPNVRSNKKKTLQKKDNKKSNRGEAA